jgi:hypothetical protein
MRRILIAFVVAALLAPGLARADLIIPTDPADIHVNGPGGFAQSAGGTDWVTLPTFNGTFNLTDVSNNQVTISPWHLVIAIPNLTGSILDTITQVGTTSVAIAPAAEITLTAASSGSAYDALGLSGAPASLSFANFVLADQAVDGGAAPTKYGLYDFAITPASLALLSQVSENVTLGGTLPAGSILFAYGTGDDGKLYSTAFTNAGVITPLAVTPTPEPSTLVSAAAGLVVGAVLGLLRLRKARAA